MGLCLCVRASYRCAARCDRRGPKGLRRAWSLAGFVPSLLLQAGSLPAPSLSPALSPVRALQMTHTPPFPSAPAQRIASLHATQTHTHTHTHTHSTIVKPDPVLRAPAVKPVSRVLQYNKNIGKNQNKTCIK